MHPARSFEKLVVSAGKVRCPEPGVKPDLKIKCTLDMRDNWSVEVVSPSHSLVTLQKMDLKELSCPPTVQ